MFHVRLGHGASTNITIITIIQNMGPDSSVGIATCYGLDGPGIESR